MCKNQPVDVGPQYKKQLGQLKVKCHFCSKPPFTLEELGQHMQEDHVACPNQESVKRFKAGELRDHLENHCSR